MHRRLFVTFVLQISMVLVLTGTQQIQAANSLPKDIPGKTAEERRKFLFNFNGNIDLKYKYLELACHDQDPSIRQVGVQILGGNMKTFAPILLELITTDPSQEVRLSAALCLNREYTSNGVDYSREDVMALEKDLKRLSKATTDTIGSRYVLEVLDEVWCSLQINTRKKILKDLDLFVTNDPENVWRNEYANNFLKKHKTVSCTRE